jgi:hypothetical protein
MLFDVRPLLSSVGFVVLSMFLGVGACEQIAGLDDLVPPPTTDASHPSDSASAGPACSCLGCSLVAFDPSGTPQSIVSVNGSVYWVDPGEDCGNDGRVMTVPAAGGALVELAGNLASPLSITTDGVSLYWYETGAASVDKLTIGSTTVEVLASGFNFDSPDNGWTAPSATSSKRLLPDTSLLAVVDGGAYFATLNAFDASEYQYELWKVPNEPSAKAEGLVGTLIGENDAGSGTGIPDADYLPESGGTQQLDPQALATGEDSLYWINCDSAPCTGTTCGTSCSTNCYSIWRIPLTGMKPVPVEVVSDLQGPVNLFVSGSTAYYVDYTSGALRSFSATGDRAQNPMTLDGAQAAPWALAHDSDFIYWTTLGTGGGGNIVKYPLKGGTPTTLATGLPAPAALAVDETNVYWVDTAYDTVCRIPKQ